MSTGEALRKDEAQLESAAISDRGLSEKRPQNEDSFVELPQYGIFAVADGVGGAQAGDVASQMAMEILGEAFVNQAPKADAEDVMRIAIERANTAIFQMARDLPQLSSMATTIVALHLSDGVATIGHVGDSRLYRVDAAGQVFRETQDHSVVEEEVRAGRMTAEQALNHPSRNVISRALGAEENVDIDLRVQMVQPSTAFLLCSDGITRHIEDWEIAALLSSGDSPDEICSQMKQLCYDRGAEDNLTAVIVRTPAAALALEHDDAETEIEQDTISTARPILDESAEVIETEESPKPEVEITDAEIAPVQEADELPDLEAEGLNDEITASGPSTSDENAFRQPETEDYSSSSVVVPANTQAATREYGIFSEAADDDSLNGDAGTVKKAAAAIGLLILGGVLGAFGAYYVGGGTAPEPVQQAPVILEQKSNNTSLTAFEEGRRQVDSDPAKYIAAEAASPQVPEDYFLLGRAFFLTGKMWEAKRAFNEAKNRLAEADPMNAKTLAAEIAMALAIIESPPASESFTKDIVASGSASNSNTAITQPSR